MHNPTAAHPGSGPQPHDGELRLALRTRQAAQALSISERLLAKLVAEKRIPFARINSVLLFPVADLQRWLSEQAAKEGNA